MRVGYEHNVHKKRQIIGSVLVVIQYIYFVLW